MLVAHLVPGYFAATQSQSTWRPKWSSKQRMLLWGAALGSTVLPDLDVVYNVLFRGFVNHSTLWTHSQFVHLAIGLGWLGLRISKRWSYLQTLVGLVAVGGLSHLVLDVISHGTPLLYPVSMTMFGFASARVVESGFFAYITDPIFLLEPLALGMVVLHWTYSGRLSPRVRTVLVAFLVVGLISFSTAFLLLLPKLQGAVALLQPRVKREAAQPVARLCKKSFDVSHGRGL